MKERIDKILRYIDGEIDLYAVATDPDLASSYLDSAVKLAGVAVALTTVETQEAMLAEI